MSLKGKTMFISGASRGIGLAIAKRAAQDGANIALIAKTAEPHPKLPGTVYTAAKELEEAGGQALPIVGDVRDPDSVESAVAKTVEQFGGIDICVNNASAINLGSISEVPMKRFDLMNGIQVRGTYAVSQACLAHMKGRENPHVLTLSPPVLLGQEWLKPTAYMMAKFGMTLCALGIAEEMREEGIASNTLWPRTLVATAAVQNLLGGEEAMGRARKPEVYSDAAYVILNKPAKEYTGNMLLCEDVLVDSGVTDLSVYDCIPGSKLGVDFWVDGVNPPGYSGSLDGMAGAATPGIAALVKAGVPHEVLHFDVVTDLSDSGDFAPEQVFKTLIIALPARAGRRGRAGAVEAVAEGGRRGAGRAQGRDGRTRCGRAVDRLRGRRDLPFGQRKRLRTVLDASALGWERILCSAGKRRLGRRGGPAGSHPADRRDHRGR